MSTKTHAAPSAPRVSRVWVLLCCLLTFTSSFNLTILTDILDPDFPAKPNESSVAENEEDIDEDSNMLRSDRAGVEGRRGERKSSAERFDAPALVAATAKPFALSRFLRAVHRAGSEHAQRNGLGVPLLC